MTQIVWIASYPRSGNTWLRFLIANLLLEKIDRSMQVATILPDIHAFVTGRHLAGPERSFIKTHWAWRDDFPLREDTESVIYLVRHPIDVVESALNYGALAAGDQLRAATPEQLERFARSFVADFVKHGGDLGWQRQGFGTWAENVASWTETPLPFRRLVVRYEALRAEPVRELSAIAEFVAIPAASERIESAVARSSIDRLRSMEEDELRSRTAGLFYDQHIARAGAGEFRFIGGAQRRRLALTETERALLRDRYAPTMAALGYD